MEIKVAAPQKQFVYQKRVFLKDTNAEGNVYFTHYFEWQGEAREEFFRKNVPDHMQILQSGTRLITVNAWTTFKRSAYLFDEISVDVKTTHLKQMTLELLFTFVHQSSGEVIAYGGQKLAFSNSTGTLVPIPNSIRENAKYFLADVSTEQTEMAESMKRSNRA